MWLGARAEDGTVLACILNGLLSRFREHTRDQLVQKSYSEHFDDYYISTFCRHDKQGIYVTLGAEYGAEGNATYALYQRGWRGLNVLLSQAATTSHKNLRPLDTCVTFDPETPETIIQHTPKFAAAGDKHKSQPCVLVIENTSAAAISAARLILSHCRFDLVLFPQKTESDPATPPIFDKLTRHADRSLGYHYYSPTAVFPANDAVLNDAFTTEPWEAALTHPQNRPHLEAEVGRRVAGLMAARGIKAAPPALDLAKLRHDKRTLGHDLSDILDDFPVTDTVVDDYANDIAQQFRDPSLSHGVYDRLFFQHVWPAQEEASRPQPDNEPNQLYRTDELAGENCCLGRSRLIRAILAKLGPEEQDLFLSIYRRHYENYTPLLVVLAERALLQDDRTEASQLLTKCLGLFYDDIYVQKLFLHATRQKILTLHLAGKYCGKPFQAFEIFQGGDVHLCCKPWQPVTVGNVFHQNHEDIWNSRRAQLVRQSIVDGSYRYCSPISCPLMKKLPDYEDTDPAVRHAVKTGSMVTKQAPYRLALSYDRSCNLSCPQCRTSMITAKGQWRQELERIETETILPLLKKVSFAYITGSGDAFGSRHFNSILHKLNRQDYPNLTLHLMTNGQLLTEKLWNNLSNLHDLPGYITVSIDGATKETYEELRRGGTFSAICQNMDMIGKVRKQGIIDRLEVNMVVQKSNFREMKRLIEMCTAWHVDAVLFYRLKQWGTYPAEDFRERDIFNPDHPDHTALLQELSDPIFESDIVNPWDLSPLLLQVGRNRQDQKAEPFLR